MDKCAKNTPDMEILSVSQKTLSELGDFQSLSADDSSKVCKYFLQVILRGRSTLELGRRQH